MANTLLTPQIIAREALLRLQSNMVMASNVYRDYSSEFAKVGDMITLRKPATFIADEFGTSINLQDIGETSTPLSLDILADVSVEVTSKEMTLDIENFGTQVLDGAMLAIAEKIDKSICEKASQGIPFFTGEAGTTPNDLKTGFTDPMKKLNLNRVPQSMRKLVFDPEAEAELLNIEAVVNAEKSGSTEALRNASIGKIMKFDTFMDQNIVTHTAGGYTVLTDVNVTAGAKGSTVITLTSTAGSATTNLVAGDLFEVDGHQYVVTADSSNAVAGVISGLQISPGLHEAFGDMGDTAVTFADQTSRAHTSNLAFHQNAIALVNAPLEVPQGGANGYTAIDPNSGLSVRVVFGYDINSKKEVMSIDCLFGTKVIYPELGCQVLG